MEDEPETGPPGPGGVSAMSGPMEKPHSQTDSFLTAARLIRRGWTEEGKKKGRQFTHSPASSPRTPSLSRSDGNQGPERVELFLKDPRVGRVVVVKSRKNEETGSDKKASEAEQTTEGESSAGRRAGGQTGVVCVWASGCRTTCKQPRRFKAPLLPVIAEN